MLLLFCVLLCNFCACIVFPLHKDHLHTCAQTETHRFVLNSVNILVSELRKTFYKETVVRVIKVNFMNFMRQTL